jgi:hypothetical protein
MKIVPTRFFKFKRTHNKNNKNTADEKKEQYCVYENYILKYNYLLLIFFLVLHVLYYMENLNNLLLFMRYYVTVYYTRECERGNNHLQQKS